MMWEVASVLSYEVLLGIFKFANRVFAGMIEAFPLYCEEIFPQTRGSMPSHDQFLRRIVKQPSFHNALDPESKDRPAIPMCHTPQNPLWQNDDTEEGLTY